MEERGRRSKDKKINGEGKKLLEYIEETGTILNVRGDEKGEFTYTGGKDETVIDYVLGEEKVRDKVERLEIGERVDSAHHPLVVCVRCNSKKERRERRCERMKRRGKWNKEDREQFQEKLGVMKGGGKMNCKKK